MNTEPTGTEAPSATCEACNAQVTAPEDDFCTDCNIGISASELITAITYLGLREMTDELGYTLGSIADELAELIDRAYDARKGT